MIHADTDQLFQVGILYPFDEYQLLQEFFHIKQLFLVINQHLIDVVLIQDHVYELIFDYVLALHQVMLYVMEYWNIYVKDVVHHIKILMLHYAIVKWDR